MRGRELEEALCHTVGAEAWPRKTCWHPNLKTTEFWVLLIVSQFPCVSVSSPRKFSKETLGPDPWLSSMDFLQIKIKSIESQNPL